MRYANTVIVQGMLILNTTDQLQPGWVEIDGMTIRDVQLGSPSATPDAGNKDAIIMPGFVDAHMHLPQIDSIGFDGLDLLDWLRTAIYPAETSWQDERAMVSQINQALQQLAFAGTLGFAGYLTSHPHSLRFLHDALNDLPLSAIAGQVLMDRHAPEGLIDQPVVTDPMSLLSPPSSHLQPSVNPRFAIACSNDLLKLAGEISRSEWSPDKPAMRPFVQTHLAETIAECELVTTLFPDDANYTSVYDRHGLLHEQTLLAHCLHLTDDEWVLIAERKSVIVHCPTANTFLQAGLFDLRKAREHGIRLALGSDIAAGCDFSMPRVGRAMIEVAKLRQLTLDDHAHVPSPSEVWQVILFDNAEALGQSGTPRIEPGRSADLLIIEPQFDIDEHFFSRLLYNWNDALITQRIIKGTAF